MQLIEKIGKMLLIAGAMVIFGTNGAYSEALEHANRPSYNTSEGFFTYGRKIYDHTGTEFITRGVNADHWGGNDNDQAHRAAIPKIKKSGANAVRIVFGKDNGDGWNNLNQTSSQREEVVKTYIENHLVPIYDYHFAGDTNELSQLESAVDLRITDKQWLKKYEKYVIINIINEWRTYWEKDASAENDIWFQGYLKAIKKLRDNGINNLLMIDSAQWSGSPYPLLKWGKKLIESDPQHNIVFDLHTYGGWLKPGDQQTIDNPYWHFNTPDLLDQLIAKEIPVIFGEFNNTVYAQGVIKDEEFLQYLEERNIGWLGWNWWLNNNENIVTTLNSNNYTKFGKIIANALIKAQEPDIFPGGITPIEPTTNPGTWNPGVLQVDNNNLGEWWLQVYVSSSDCSSIEVVEENGTQTAMNPWGDHYFTISMPLIGKKIHLVALNAEGAITKTNWFTLTKPMDNSIITINQVDGNNDGGDPDDTDQGDDPAVLNPGKIEISNDYLGSWWMQIYVENLAVSSVEYEDSNGVRTAMNPWGEHYFSISKPLLGTRIRLHLSNDSGTKVKTKWFTLEKPMANPILELDASQDDDQDDNQDTGSSSWNPEPVEVFNVGTNWLQVFVGSSEVAGVKLEVNGTIFTLDSYGDRCFKLGEAIPLQQQARLHFTSSSGVTVRTKPFVIKQVGYPGYNCEIEKTGFDETQENNNTGWNPGSVKVFNVGTNWLQISVENPDIQSVEFESSEVSSALETYGERNFVLGAGIPLNQQGRFHLTSKSGKRVSTKYLTITQTGTEGYFCEIE